MKRGNYINPRLVKTAEARLADYREKNENIPNPLTAFITANDIEADEIPVYVRAAKRLGWNIVSTCGKVYENGWRVL